MDKTIIEEQANESNIPVFDINAIIIENEQLKKENEKIRKESKELIILYRALRENIDELKKIFISM